MKWKSHKFHGAKRNEKLHLFSLNCLNLTFTEKETIFLYIRTDIILIEMETVTIPKEEYERLKKLEQLDFDLIRQFASSLEDLKQGRFKRLA